MQLGALGSGDWIEIVAAHFVGDSIIWVYVDSRADPWWNVIGYKDTVTSYTDTYFIIMSDWYAIGEAIFMIFG